MMQDLVVTLAAQRHAVGAHLAQADAVPPPLAAEDERLDLAAGVARAIDGEQVLADPEGGPDAEALEDEIAAAARDPDLHDAAAHPPAGRLDVDERADVDALAHQRLQLAARAAILPAIDRGVTIVRDAARVGDQLEIIDGAVGREVEEDPVAERERHALRRVR